MLVTFVGGRRHGKRCDWNECPQVYPLKWSDATAALYEKRRETTETIGGHTEMIHITCALHGMSEDEFHELTQEIGPP